MTVVNELDYLSHVNVLRAHAYKLMYVFFFRSVYPFGSNLSVL